MITTPDITRPDRAIIEGLREIGSATASGELSLINNALHSWQVFLLYYPKEGADV